jgi:TRAP-type C4-dicarboxylate transport system permease large subunit
MAKGWRGAHLEQMGEGQPVILKLGFDPIWFGIMGVLVVQCGWMNPSVGMNAFVIKGIASDVPRYTLY